MSTVPTQPSEVLLLTQIEASALTRVHRATLWALRRRPRDPIPTVRIAGRVLFPREELLRWIMRQRERRALPVPRRGRPPKTIAVSR